MENLLRHYLEEAFLKSEIPGRSKPLPFVTISREYGCPSKMIGVKLTDALNRRKKPDDPNRWKFINKEVLETAARELNLPAVQVASLLSAEQKGVEVSEAKFKLQDATTALVLARNLTHGLSLPEIEKSLGEGAKVLEEVKVSGEAALREAKFRRSGLIIATLFILLLALALYLKIRDLQRPPKPER